MSRCLVVFGVFLFSFLFAPDFLSCTRCVVLVFAACSDLRQKNEDLRILPEPIALSEQPPQPESLA